MKLVFLGPPGAGKGTQAVRIADKFEIPHISTGDIFRENLRNKTPLGLKAKEYMESGGLVPDELVIDIVMDRLKKDDCQSGYLLDGFPRTIPQAEGLDKGLGEKGESLDHVIYLKTSDEVVLERLTGRRSCVACGRIFHVTNIPPRQDGVCDSCGGELIQRSDDTEETVKNRLKVYYDETADLIEYYRNAGLLREMSGDKDVEDLYEDIVALLKGE